MYTVQLFLLQTIGFQKKIQFPKLFRSIPLYSHLKLEYLFLNYFSIFKHIQNVFFLRSMLCSSFSDCHVCSSFFFNWWLDEKKILMKSNFSGPLVQQLLFTFHLKYTYLSLNPNTKMFFYNFLVSFNDFSLIFLQFDNQFYMLVLNQS